MFGKFLFVFVHISVIAVQAAAQETQKSGYDLYVQYCADCHHADGTGGETTIQALGTVPADLTKISARRDGVWPMLEVMSIVDGYTKPNAARDDMPTFAVLSEGPQMDMDTGNGRTILIPVRLFAIANYLESIQSPKPERHVP